MAETKTVSIKEQIKIAMDGRTQRWLSLNTKIPETELSKKFNIEGYTFSEDEIKSIETALGTKFTQ